jgi:ankyrin repeat protein
VGVTEAQSGRMNKTRRNLLVAVGAASALAIAEPADEKPASTAGATESEKFRQVVIAGDLTAVSAMLDRDLALRYTRDAAGVSVYILACLHGQTKVADELVRRGLVLDIFEAAVSGNTARATEIYKDDPGVALHRLPDGRTPLHLAAEGGKHDMVFFFSSRGGNLSAGPESPLFAAVDYPDRAEAGELSRFLLGNASDPNARRKDGKTALHLAAARGYYDIVEQLIHRGADPGVRDGNGKTALDVASGDAIATLRRTDKIARVHFDRRYTQDLHGNPVKRDDTYGIPQALINEMSTVAHFNFDRVKELQKICPLLVMTRATWDELAIEAAAHMGLVPMAQFLADLNAPVSTCTAAILGARDMVKRLIREDPACVHERGAHDISIMAFTAYGNQQTEIADMLLAAGADLTARALGQTVLHVAASKGHVELAQLLLDRGADINATAKIRGSMITPRAFAILAKQEKMAEFLKQRGGA